jgi:preprotein translocase subunit YajC
MFEPTDGSVSGGHVDSALHPDAADLLGQVVAAVDACHAVDVDRFYVATLAALLEGLQRQLNRLEGALLSWTGVFDRRRGAKSVGLKDTQHFLQQRLRHTPSKAKATTDTARALRDGLDATRAALAAGDIDAAQAAAIAAGTRRIAGRPGPDLAGAGATDSRSPHAPQNLRSPELWVSSPVSGSPAQADPWITLIPLLLIFVIFWFLIIRPQSKRAKQHREMVGALKTGDEVVTQGGILGRIVAIDESFATLEIAQNVRIRVQRHMVGAVMPKGTIASLD